MKRIKANDPAAMYHLGTCRYHEGDNDIAIKYWTMAAELGDINAHYQLADSYSKGEGVETDEEKAIYHYEQAAIGGDPEARYNLGWIEGTNGNMERAAKHHIIAANLGHEGSMKLLWKHYSRGDIAKEDLESTLRTHKAAIDEMKSPQREAAEKAWS
jgi:TPR repeat protein